MKYNLFKNRLTSLPVFASSLLSALTPRVGTLKVQLSDWKKRGLIVSLRRGLYVLNRGDRQIEPSLFYLANQIFGPSYVSLESALAYHGLIPEFVGTTTSVTVKKTNRFENEFGIFTYQHVQPEAYTGFESIRESEKMSVLVATPEKAVADFIYFNLENFDLSDRTVFKASYRFQSGARLDAKKLKGYATCFGNKKLTAGVNLFTDEMIL